MDFLCATESARRPVSGRVPGIAPAPCSSAALGAGFARDVAGAGFAGAGAAPTDPILSVIFFESTSNCAWARCGVMAISRAASAAPTRT